MSDLNSKIEAARTEVSNLTSEIDKVRAQKKDSTMGTVVRNDQKQLPSLRGPPATKCRRTLKGHFGKVTALHWAGDSQSLVSASQDGKLILWNAVSTNKNGIISLKSSYVLTVGMEQTKGDMVACGGLDNLCTVYRFSKPDVAMEMASHEGFLSCCRFISPSQIVTSSGDSTAKLWDIESGRVLDSFTEHTADVMHLSLQKNTMLTCSVDKSVKLWDLRDAKKSVQTFAGFHESDVNSVEWMPSDSNTFGTASDDGTCRVFDTRAYNEVNKFGKTKTDSAAIGGEGFTSVSFSRSGRILFAGHSDSNVMAFDVLSDKNSPSFVLSGHDSHVTDIGVNPKGDALCTASWDTNLKIWA